MLSSELVILQNVVLVQCDVTMQSNGWQLCTIYSKLNIETIPSDGPHYEWINGMVIALALPNWGWYEFLGGYGQHLLLAAMPGFWWGNGWCGHKNWTQMSTRIPLESSFQQLSINVKKYGGSYMKSYKIIFWRYKLSLLAWVFHSAQTRRYPWWPDGWALVCFDILESSSTCPSNGQFEGIISKALAIGGIIIFYWLLNWMVYWVLRCVFAWLLAKILCLPIHWLLGWLLS